MFVAFLSFVFCRFSWFHWGRLSDSGSKSLANMSNIVDDISIWLVAHQSLKNKYEQQAMESNKMKLQLERPVAEAISKCWLIQYSVTHNRILALSEYQHTYTHCSHRFRATKGKQTKLKREREKAK